MTLTKVLVAHRITSSNCFLKRMLSIKVFIEYLQYFIHLFQYKKSDQHNFPQKLALQRLLSFHKEVFWWIIQNCVLLAPVTGSFGHTFMSTWMVRVVENITGRTILLFRKTDFEVTSIDLTWKISLKWLGGPLRMRWRWKLLFRKRR